MPKRSRTQTTTKRVAKKARRTYKRKQSGAIGPLALRLFETKKHETRAGEVSINSLSGWYADGGAMVLSQNDAYSGLEGHMIRGKGISIRGFIKNNATTTQLVRLGVMRVKQGASKMNDFAAGTDVLEGNTANANITTATSVQRMTQRFNQEQYHQVKAMFFKLGNNTATDGTDVRPFKMWIPLNGQPFRYDGPGTFPTRNVYALFCLNVLGNNDESTGENVELSYTTTFYYVDP